MNDTSCTADNGYALLRLGRSTSLKVGAVILFLVVSVGTLFLLSVQNNRILRQGFGLGIPQALQLPENLLMFLQKIPLTS